VKPPRALPRKVSIERTREKVARRTISGAGAAEALVIQVVPHHNGEVFLSKRAVDQNPDFFGWPFTGLTVPKLMGRPAYPQRIPDPVVNLRVYDAAGTVTHSLDNYGVNTVYYSPKSEIRITITKPIADAIPEYAI